MTDCCQQTFGFQALGSRRVEADFGGGHLSSDGGVLLLRETDRRLGLCDKLARCFSDTRDERFVEHTLPVMIRQRVLGLALGYEDLNDHEQLRTDPLLAAACENPDLLGETRRHEQDRGKALAGKSTLNRLELGAVSDSTGKYRKIKADPAALRDLLLDEGIKSIPRKSRVIVLDFDATDDPIHGNQEGRFFHGYYGNYCYLPLYCFCGDIPLWAELRTSDRDGSQGTLQALQHIIPAIRKRLGNDIKIIIRGDSGFCRDELMTWIEAQPGVHYVLGLARNKRLQALLQPTFQTLHTSHAAACEAARREGREAPHGARAFGEFTYQTQDSWSRPRRVIGKAEILGEKDNPRFIVTDLTGEEDWAEDLPEFKNAAALYEKFYCARGDMENRIKEQQLDLFADRTSTAPFAGNQLRLWFSTFAYLLVARLRGIALQGTVLAKATAGTIRLRLFKVAAMVVVSVRRVHVRMSGAFPLQEIFQQASVRLGSG
jgi:Transposase DDE domain group 1